MKILILLVLFALEVYFGVTQLLPYLMQSKLEILSHHAMGFYWGYLMVAAVSNVVLFFLPFGNGKTSK